MCNDWTIPLLVQLQFIRPASLTNRLSITIIIEEMLWFCFNCFDGFSATEQNSTSVDYDGRSWKKRRWWVLVGKTLSTLLVRDCKNLKPRYVKILGWWWCSMTCRGAGSFSKINNITVLFRLGKTIKTIEAKQKCFLNNDFNTKAIR